MLQRCFYNVLLIHPEPSVEIKKRVFLSLRSLKLKSETKHVEMSRSHSESMFLVFVLFCFSFKHFFCLFALPRLDCLSGPFQVHQHLNCDSKEAAPRCEPETLCRRLCSGSQMTQKQTCVHVRARVLACVGLRARGRVASMRVSKCVRALRALQGGEGRWGEGRKADAER